ncbi:MAG: metallophosphoesterase [Bacteroidales bacterium]|nr:metallophosphoesterase [Bacteroidales bacterium]
MKIAFFLFILTFVIGYNYYVFIRGLSILPSIAFVRYLYSIVFWTLTLSFFVRMFYGERLPQTAMVALSAVAFTWLVAVIYFLLISLGFDLIRVLNHFFDIYPRFIKENYAAAKSISAIVSITGVSLLLLYGNYSFNNPQATRLEISIKKALPGDGIRLVMMSDLHLGSSINGEDLSRFVEMINREKADIVLIAGDIADMNLEPLIRWDVAGRLSKIESKYGTYAISGNHEFYAGEKEKIYSYLRSSGVNVLIDSVAIVGDSIQIVGRDDKTNSKRAPLSEILKNIERTKPIILMDHQPFNLEQAQNEGVDLQLSGHTHNGQFWPGSLIVKWMYELSYGYKMKGDTHYFVSSGIGLWGPKFRIGTKSEIVVIDIKSKI